MCVSSSVLPEKLGDQSLGASADPVKNSVLCSRPDSTAATKGTSVMGPVPEHTGRQSTL